MILTPFLTTLCCLSAHAAPVDAPLTGGYVEARTLSVFAGACHYAGERTTDGREALLAWTIESGTYHGVDLAGTAVAVAIADDENLVDAPVARRSVVYVTESARDDQRDALVAWLRTQSTVSLGEVRAVRVVALTLAVDDETFAVSVPGVLGLAGGALPDRACCHMPYLVWYSPFVVLGRPLVGRDGQFTLREPALDRVWSRPGENAAFFGRFGTPVSSLGAPDSAQ